MRLKKSRNASEEETILLLNSGYQLLNWLKADYIQKRNSRTFNAATDHQRYTDAVNEWGRNVNAALNSIFPTELESNQFLHPPSHFGAIAAENNDDYKAGSLRARVDDLLKGKRSRGKLIKNQ